VVAAVVRPVVDLVAAAVVGFSWGGKLPAIADTCGLKIVVVEGFYLIRCDFFPLFHIGIIA
jgi:hypothetical protein